MLGESPEWDSRRKNTTYDMVSGYIRYKIRHPNASSKVRLSEEELTRLMTFRRKDHGAEKDGIGAAIAEIGDKLNRKLIRNYTNANELFADDISIMEDLEKTYTEVKDSYDHCMISWLLADQHTLSWERVVMLLVFTHDRIVGTLNGSNPETIADAHKRVSHIVDIAVDFICDNMHAWIFLTQDGWHVVRTAKEEWMKDRQYDVPIKPIRFRENIAYKNVGQGGSPSELCTKLQRENINDREPAYKLLNEECQIQIGITKPKLTKV